MSVGSTDERSARMSKADIKVKLSSSRSASWRELRDRVLKSSRVYGIGLFGLPAGTLIHTEQHYPIYVVNDNIWLDGHSGIYVRPWPVRCHLGDACER